MKLDFKLIKKYSNENLIVYLQPLIEDIKKEVDYIKIDEKTLDDLIVNTIKENLSRIKYTDRRKRKNFIVKLVKDKIRIYFILNKRKIEYLKPLNLENLNSDNSKSLESSSLIYFLSKIQSYILTPNEEKEFLKQIKLGNSQAKDFFIERNLKLVVKISKKYLGCGLNWEELIQEGTIGLIEAIDKFDIEKNVKFSTYATWWIRQRIQRAIEDYARIIRLSSNRLIQIKKYKKLKETIENSSDTNLTIELLCKTFNIEYMSALKLYYMEKDVLYFEDILNNEELINKYKLNDLCNNKTPNDVYKEKELKESVNNLLNNVNLTDLELQIIKLKYGFDGKEPLTINEISKKLDYTVTWISQLEISAMKKIWNSKELENLLIYSKDSEVAKDLIKYYKDFYSESKNMNKSYKKVLKKYYKIKKYSN